MADWIAKRTDEVVKRSTTEKEDYKLRAQSSRSTSEDFVLRAAMTRSFPALTGPEAPSDQGDHPSLPGRLPAGRAGPLPELYLYSRTSFMPLCRDDYAEALPLSGKLATSASAKALSDRTP